MTFDLPGVIAKHNAFRAGNGFDIRMDRVMDYLESTGGVNINPPYQRTHVWTDAQARRRAATSASPLNMGA